MNAHINPVSRRFPRLSWAWPAGGRHLLITAAICPDDDRAFAAIQQWLHETDLDAATFAEHRLLASITTRFDQRLMPHDEYPRLCGLQRLNWTKSRMAISATKPALEMMVDAGLQIILLKGACRVALDITEQKSRTSYDLDLLLDPEDFVHAFEILAKDGWKSTRGESVLGLRARLSSVRARNFKKGRFGDIDLHKAGYHNTRANDALDQHLLHDVLPVQFYGLKVFIPSTEERIALAIGHGGWDGHSHSDWLVDLAGILEKETVDWDKFTKIIRGRKLQEQAAIALSYLSQEIGVHIPTEVRLEICDWRVLSAPSRIGAMLLAKESESMSRGQKLVRSMVRGLHRSRSSGRDKSQDTSIFRALTKTTNQHSLTECALTHQITIPDIPPTGTLSFNITIDMPAPRKRRRIELELNGAHRNICHLQIFHIWTSEGNVSARFRGEVVVTPEDWPLNLTALPGKLLVHTSGGGEREKHDAVPFRVRTSDFRYKG